MSFVPPGMTSIVNGRFVPDGYTCVPPFGASTAEATAWLRDFASFLAESDSITWDDATLINVYLNADRPVTFVPPDLRDVSEAEAVLFRDSLAAAAIEASAFSAPAGRQPVGRHARTVGVGRAILWATLAIERMLGNIEVDMASYEASAPVERRHEQPEDPFSPFNPFDDPFSPFDVDSSQ